MTRAEASIQACHDGIFVDAECVVGGPLVETIAGLATADVVLLAPSSSLSVSS